MALTESIFAAISANPGVQAALGIAAPPFPIFPNRAPDGQGLPFVVFNQVAGVIDNTHNDAGQFMETLYQFSCYATKFADARAIRTAIIKALIALDATGLAGGEKFTVETQRDMYEPQADAHHLILEVRFFCDPTAI